MKLNPRQKAFADEYIKNGGNATQAAKKAGYSEKMAYSHGSWLTKRPEVAAYIAARQKAVEDERIASIAEIQRFRSAVLRGEEKDQFGMDVSAADRLKAADALEKALRIRADEEAKQRAREEALKAGTYHLDLDMIPDPFHAAIRDIRQHRHVEYVFKGGRGSGKSSMIPNIITELMRNKHELHALVVRKVGNTIKDSVFAKSKWAINMQGFADEYASITSPYEITLKATGQKIYFRGADDPTKIKSIAPEFGYIGILWFEELDQFAGDAEVRSIEQSAIRGGDLAWIFKSFNPPKSINNWANKSLEIPKDNRLIHSSTYLDVPQEWLGKTFLEEAEHQKEVNPEAYEHEYLGKPNGTGGAVFEYLQFEDITDDQIATFDRIYQGVDWGWYPDPFAFIRAYYDHARETIYLIDEIYCNKQKNDQTAQRVKEKGYNDYTITCDGAEPKSVADYRDEGLPARAAVKGPGSVEYGMKWLQGRKIVIDVRRTPNAAREFREYEYERDKDGNIISGYPDKDNHTIDALRYAFESFYNRRGNSA